MIITLDMIKEHIQLNRNSAGIYIFHDINLFQEMSNNLDNYVLLASGVYELLPGVKQTYIYKDAKKYLESMLGD